MSDSLGLKLKVHGIPSLTNFSYNSEQNQKYKTLITQEMLKKGYLASNVVYACTAHSDEIIDGYILI